MTVRGVRGATVVPSDEPESISSATQELMRAILLANPSLKPADLASVILTVTADLRAAYPASAVRVLSGWEDVPLLCAQEIPVPGGLQRCLRVLIHWNTSLPQQAVQHVYLGEAVKLRPDLQEFK